MITTENLESVLRKLTTKEIGEAMKSGQHYIVLRLHIFNSDWLASIEAVDYDEELVQEIQATGNVFAEKCVFQEMLEELNINY